MTIIELVYKIKGYLKMSIVKVVLLIQYSYKKLVFRKIKSILYTVQQNLDIRKILGATKISLKSRFFLISNTRKPMKMHNFIK